MQKSRWTHSILLAVSLLGFPSVSTAGSHPQNHDGWHIGFGFGGGSAAVSVDGEGSSTREGGGAGNFRIGVPINEKVSIGLESNAWVKSENNVTISFNAATAAVSFFPSEGLVLRGGLGLGRTTLSASSGGTTATVSESGFGANAGIGYEFRLARTFALGPQVDFGLATFDGGKANWVNFGLQFNWYFVPKS